MPNYTVKPGDTFTIISNLKFGIPTEAANIANANPGVKEPLIPGTSLVIPPQEDLDLPTIPSKGDGKVTLKVGFVEFDQWESGSFTRGVDSISTFVLETTQTSDPRFRAAFKPLTFQECELKIGGETVITGYIVNPNPDAGTGKVRVEGYGKPGVLNDSYFPDNIKSLVFRKKKLSQIAKEVCRPWGIRVKLQGDGPLPPDEGNPFPRVKLEVGQKALDFLADLAEDRGFILTDDESGALVLTKTTVPLPVPGLRVKRGERPYIGEGAVLNTSPQEFYSHVTGFRSGFAGTKRTETNSFLSDVLRPYNYKVARSERRDITLSVKTKMGRMLAQAVSVNINLATWSTRLGNLIQKGELIELTDDKLWIDRPYNFLLREITCEFGNTSTRISRCLLVLPGTFAGSPPSVLPFG